VSNLVQQQYFTSDILYVLSSQYSDNYVNCMYVLANLKRAVYVK